MALFAGTPDAQARAVTPPALVSVNHAVAATHHWERAARQPLTQYHWGAHRATTTTQARWRIAIRWWDHAWAAHAYYLKHRPTTPWPSWWLAPALCIHSHEGSWTNPNYGGMGLVYQTGYDGPAGTVARMYGARYGGDLARWPASAQLHVAYALYTMHGWAPWPNTARMCGLL